MDICYDDQYKIGYRFVGNFVDRLTSTKILPAET